MPGISSRIWTFVSRVWTFLWRIWTPFQNACFQLAGMQGEEGLEETTEDLLPGILNEITLHQIVPKLLWRDFYVLSAVSPAWRHAIRSGQVHKVRSRLHSAETVVPVIYTRSAIALYCSTGSSWHQLPPIPNASGGRLQFLPWSSPIHDVPVRRFHFSPWSGCISMDGKIYVLGRFCGKRVNYSLTTDCELYAFDLGRLGKWQQLASVAEPRESFALGVKDEKIYVFGGFGLHDEIGEPIPVLGGEVYDPEENRWSRIKPMTCPRFGHYVETVGEELFLLNGSGSRRYPSDDYPEGPLQFAEAYHPVEDQWRVVESFSSPVGDFGPLFTARGKLYSTSFDSNHSLDIHEYDVDRNSWTALHSFSLAGILPVDSDLPDLARQVGPLGYTHFASRPLVIGIQAVEDELLATVLWRRTEREIELFLLQSKCFGSRNTEMSWQLTALSTTGLLDFTHKNVHAISCCLCRC